MSKSKELEIDTKRYWETSLAFNGRTESKLTVEKAIKSVNAILDRTNSTRTLAIVSNCLMDDIIGISQKPKKQSKKNPASKAIKINERIS